MFYTAGTLQGRQFGKQNQERSAVKQNSSPRKNKLQVHLST